MSGGHFDYQQWRISEIADNLKQYDVEQDVET